MGSAVEFTRLSEKGQVVIPSEMRKKMKLKDGTRFVVLGLQDTIVLRKVEPLAERDRLKHLLSESRKRARKSGLSEREIEHLIQSSRKIST